ncbi:MAG: hypothetical protein U0793_15970 [Gemmataceae bacterium]
MTREQARDYRRRWRLVNVAQRAEVRRMTIEDKFRELADLMAAARAWGWTTSLSRDAALGRNSWLRLYRAYGVIK